MTSFEIKGKAIKDSTKALILDYMKSNIYCSPNGRGVKQSEIFYSCGLAANNNKKATITNQQYWMIALLYELQDEGQIELICERGPWRLK